MASVSPDIIRNDDGSMSVIWKNIKQGDVCEYASVPSYPDKTFHVGGTPNGGTITFAGRNKGISGEVPIKDNTNTAISLTAVGGGFMLENYNQFRPVLSGGGGSTDLTVSVNCI